MKLKKVMFLSILTAAFLFLSSSCAGYRQEGKTEADPIISEPIEILFLGHDSEHHNSAKFAPMLARPLFRKGINLTYTEEVQDLNPEYLKKFDGLMIYANQVEITPDQEEALKSFVEGGKALIPIHSASFMFQNSDWYIHAVGAQFKSHGTGTFTADIVKPDHPAMQGLSEFETWDETYVHHKINSDINVLMERVEDGHNEPWTWVRAQGEGKVFYTAYGHDERTWGNPGFHELIANGVLWAVDDKVKEQWKAYREEMPTLVYKDIPNIPNYEKRTPAPQYQMPLSPEESKKLIQVPPGFELQLFASEPDIVNPISMAWDEKGRLWVIETVDYPNSVRNEAGVGDDVIKILEDTNGDGKADKTTVFADDLNIPTSMVFSNGGIIVSQAPHFLFLKDTDGDDKADVRKQIITGWGTFDTHAGPSNLSYGMDNKIWGVVGYSGFEGEIAGEPMEFGQGIYRFSPDLSNFEFLTSTSNNTWGLGFTEDNNIFASTANNTHSVFMGIPNRYFEGVEGISPDGSVKIDGHYAMHPVTEKVRQVDVFGGFTAAAGHRFYTARDYPKKFWNKIAFVAEPTGHLVHMAKIKEDGAGFKEEDGWNLFAGADEWVAPVEAKVGPDGAVWILDWYNFIVQHNPTPTEERGGYDAETGEGNAYVNPLRDRTHGRIWRIVYKGAKADEPIRLDKSRPNELVETLKNDNMFWRMTAQRLLVERGEKDVLPELYTLVKNNTEDEMGLNPAALHALWTIHGLGALEGNNEEANQIAVDALTHPAASVRQAAIQVLPESVWSSELLHQAGLLEDSDPNTLLAVILALSEMEQPSEETGKFLYELSQKEKITQDPFLSKAVYIAATKHPESFSGAYLEEHPDFKKKNENEEVSQPKDIALQGPDIDDSQWKKMELPTYIEQAGLEIDGIIWFRRTIEVPEAAAGKKAVLSLGPIDDADDTWINGVKVGGMESFSEDRVYNVPEGVLKAGENVISIKVEDTGGGGGLYGEANNMYLSLANQDKISLAGDWKYRVTKETTTKKVNTFENSTIGDLFIKYYGSKAQVDEGVANAAEDVSVNVVEIGVIKNKMKFDVESFTVKAGEKVKIVFTNPDFMQHNVVIGKQGELETIGLAADELAMSPEGAKMQYVPDIPEVLFNTPLVDPQGTVTLIFIAPEEPGLYPFVCTFPGHWRMMNGTMKVVESE